MKRLYLSLLYLFIYNISLAQYSDISKLNEAVKKALPGDTLILKNGIYKDVELTFAAKGDSIRPIVVLAETLGGVQVTGASTLRISGIGLEVNGLFFTNGFAPKGAVWEYRVGSESASHCRITNSAIYNYDPKSRETEYSWVLLYGRKNRFDHNTLSGKLNHGVTLAVILNEQSDNENHHLIEWNKFLDRPNLGSNGGETIRVGTSQSSLWSSRTIIRNNLFEKCDGEVEIVSIKSCDNIISDNLFLESAGVLALRHGHRNLVTRNNFIGNGKPNTGGIRIINEGHIIKDNFFQDLKGDRFFAALAIMNAVPNSLPNRYHQVRDVLIENNTWYNCDQILFGVGKDNERTLPPHNVTLKKNNFINRSSPTVYRSFDKMDGFIFIDNKFYSSNQGFKKAGFSKSNSFVVTSPVIRFQKDSLGASWFKQPEKKYKALSGKIIPISTGQNSLVEAIKTSKEGDILELSQEGEYFIDQMLPVSHYLVVRASSALKTQPVIRYNGSRSRVSIFTIMDGGILELKGISFNNESLPGKSSSVSAISPATEMKGHYSAWIEDCKFYNYTESSMSPFRAQKTTFADTLIFKNCLFRDMSGDAIYLAAEKDDAGKYSADYVEVTNCSFYKVLGYATDLYRGGSDESTSGPTIMINHCNLEDVNNKERGAGFRLFGVQNITVKNSSFSNTGRGGASIRFDENSWDKIKVTHCNFYNSGRVFSFFGKVVTGPVFNLKPVYRNAASYDFTQSSTSPLLKKAKDGRAIGLNR